MVEPRSVFCFICFWLASLLFWAYMPILFICSCSFDFALDFYEGILINSRRTLLDFGFVWNATNVVNFCVTLEVLRLQQSVSSYILGCIDDAILLYCCSCKSSMIWYDISFRYSPEQLVDVVAAVDLYHGFVPWCQRFKVTWLMRLVN